MNTIFHIPHIKNSYYVLFSDGEKEPEKNMDIVTHLVLLCSKRIPEAV